MMDFARRSREIRYWIVKSLAHLYPEGVEVQAILNTLAGVGLSMSEAELDREIAYLAEKGYVLAETLGRGVLKRRIVRDLAKGMDLLDDNIPADPGVGLG